MRIEREGQGNTLTLKLNGRLDSSAAPEFQARVERELEGVTEFTLDMERVEYVSSAGLRVLLAACKKMKAQNGVMTVWHVNDDVMEVFRITGFDKILDIR